MELPSVMTSGGNNMSNFFQVYDVYNMMYDVCL
jgi:hypothetical protein